MRRRVPWYMVPRTMKPWQLRLEELSMVVGAGGFGFVWSYVLVRVPSRTEYESMSAPAWLLWAGVGCGIAGISLLALARCTAPIYDADLDSPGAHTEPARSGARTLMLCALMFVGATATTSLVSSSSPHRWTPLWFLILPIIVVPVVMGLRGEDS